MKSLHVKRSISTCTAVLFAVSLLVWPLPRSCRHSLVATMMTSSPALTQHKLYHKPSDLGVRHFTLPGKSALQSSSMLRPADARIIIIILCLLHHFVEASFEMQSDLYSRLLIIAHLQNVINWLITFSNIKYESYLMLTPLSISSESYGKGVVLTTKDLSESKTS